MKQFAMVAIIDADVRDIYRWFRYNKPWMSLKDALDAAKQEVINFNGDYETAVNFYNYLHGHGPNSARLVIDTSYDTRGVVWNSVVQLDGESER